MNTTTDTRLEGPNEDRQRLYDVLFGLQSEMEKVSKTTGVISYKRYAEMLWSKLGFAKDDGPFKAFERQLIREMRSIPMDDLVDKALTDPATLKGLLELPGVIALWTTGDASVTRYQKWKVLKSQVGQSVHQLIGESIEPTMTTKSFLRQEPRSDHGRVVSIVADDKMKALREHIESAKPTKIVVVEDSRKNLDAVQKLALDIDPVIEVVPIWCTSTREGTELRASDRTKFDQVCSDTMNIASMSEILEKTNQIAPDDRTLWLIDFDGVVADNVQMRERQMDAKMRAIQSVLPDVHTERDILDLLEKAKV
ncbi:MAG: hypothetical protein ABL890_00215 [Candidatus Peribacteraceae bacterium]